MGLSTTFAYENDFVKVNPSIGIKLPKYDIPPDDPAHIFTNEECKFGYRESIFKNILKGQYIITSVRFQLKKARYEAYG